MSHTRRTLLWALSAGGLLPAAAPAVAADEVPPGASWSGVDLYIARGGARIEALDPLGPAARAGLRPGDLVTGCDGGGLDQLPVAFSGPPGTLVELAVRRGQARRTVRLVLETQESARP